MTIMYEGVEYKIYNEVANQYRAVSEDVEIWFECEWRGGSYFKIKSVSYCGRTYQAQRYHYSYIPIVREATFEIAKTDGLWDYKNNSLHTLYEAGWEVRV